MDRKLSILAAAAILAVAACTGTSGASSPTPPIGSSDPGQSGEPAASLATAGELRLGYFPNVTHAPAIVAIRSGDLQESLGATTLTTFTFNAGGEAAEAILSDSLDATFIGPNPAINAFAQSEGQAIRIVAGATSGGAFLVVKPEINSAADLKGKKLATPALGNTQDVALRAWLSEQGLTTTKEGGGDVPIIPQQNSQTLETFISGEIQGAWVPEPWATRLIEEGGGKVLVDERDLWPDGKYVTTHLIVRTAFLEQYPGTVKALIEAELAAQQLIESDPARAQQFVSEGIAEVTGSEVGQDVLEKSWANLTFTLDPISSSLHKSAEDATSLQLLDAVDLTGIYDVSILNQVLADAGEPEVTAQ